MKRTNIAIFAALGVLSAILFLGGTSEAYGQSTVIPSVTPNMILGVPIQLPTYISQLNKTPIPISTNANLRLNVDGFQLVGETINMRRAFFDSMGAVGQVYSALILVAEIIFIGIAVLVTIKNLRNAPNNIQNYVKDRADGGRTLYKDAFGKRPKK